MTSKEVSELCEKVTKSLLDILGSQTLLALLRIIQTIVPLHHTFDNQNHTHATLGTLQYEDISQGAQLSRFGGVGDSQDVTFHMPQEEPWFQAFKRRKASYSDGTMTTPPNNNNVSRQWRLRVDHQNEGDFGAVLCHDSYLQAPHDKQLPSEHYTNDRLTGSKRKCTVTTGSSTGNDHAGYNINDGENIEYGYTVTLPISPPPSPSSHTADLDGESNTDIVASTVGTTGQSYDTKSHPRYPPSKEMTVSDSPYTAH